ncbi:MAG TPA: diadenylate cyclase CdaA [Candidatus Krumholzibacteria bacterium]|nr:diadenylate cyclase CdaA [Candidatus Krumholzibacteria bacterium]HRX49817.1 diadenylate cyclase CdaA [Candidatus Krumholzibacteria bacterium]
MLDAIANSLIIDVLDILIVAFLLYRLLLLVRGTRTVQMFIGLALLVMLSWIADRLGMIVVKQIISSLQTVWVVAFIIIFQPELRTALTYLGRRRGLNIFTAQDDLPSEQEVVRAVERLSRRGLGALIVLEREISLGRWARTGTMINADVTSELIESIFTVPGPLHDGAIIVSRDKVVAASCILPITERTEFGFMLGTRHRAAIGLSELCDAVVIVVSEETRAISLVYRGEIRRGLSGDDLTAELNRIFTLTNRAETDEDAPAAADA